MAESGLFNAPPAAPISCPRCGRLVEGPLEVQDADGTKHRIAGHVQGDPRLCVPVPTLEGAARDNRARKRNRRGGG